MVSEGGTFLGVFSLTLESGFLILFPIDIPNLENLDLADYLLNVCCTRYHMKAFSHLRNHSVKSVI